MILAHFYFVSTQLGLAQAAQATPYWSVLWFHENHSMMGVYQLLCSSGIQKWVTKYDFENIMPKQFTLGLPSLPIGPSGQLEKNIAWWVFFHSSAHQETDDGYQNIFFGMSYQPNYAQPGPAFKLGN